MTQSVRKVARTTQQPTEAPARTTGRPKHELVDEIDELLEEIDAVLKEVAGGQESTQAETFVRNFVQKGGE